MPFEHCTPQSLTAGSVRMNAPAASGLYGLSNAREWVYIGQTDNIQASILQDLLQINSPLRQLSPTGFVFELCAPSGRMARHQRLIMEYEPVCNRRMASGAGGAA